MEHLPIAAGFLRHYKTLNSDQREFVSVLNGWFRKKRNVVVIVTGGPGTGKTHAVFRTLDHLKCKTLRLAFNNKVANAIGGRTIHSHFRINFREGSAMARVYNESVVFEGQGRESYINACDRLSRDLCESEFTPTLMKPDIVAIDEIGLVPFWFVHQIVFHFQRRSPHTLFVFSGDECQLRPTGCLYNVFDVPVENVKNIVVRFQKNHRFEDDYGDVIHSMQELLDPVSGKKLFEVIRKNFNICTNVNEATVLSCDLVMAFRNDSVRLYNELYLEHFHGGEEMNIWKVIDDVRFPDDNLHLKVGCKIMMTRNVRFRGVNFINGTYFSFAGYDEMEDVLLVDDGKVCLPRINGQFPVTLCFAATIHKLQGETIDQERVLIDLNESKNAHLVYTAFSRVRNAEQIVAVTNLPQFQEKEVGDTK